MPYMWMVYLKHSFHYICILLLPAPPYFKQYLLSFIMLFSYVYMPRTSICFTPHVLSSPPPSPTDLFPQTVPKGKNLKLIFPCSWRYSCITPTQMFWMISKSWSHFQFLVILYNSLKISGEILKCHCKNLHVKLNKN
jgi:hypothetical protein